MVGTKGPKVDVKSISCLFLTAAVRLKLPSLLGQVHQYSNYGEI